MLVVLREIAVMYIYVPCCHLNAHGVGIVFPSREHLVTKPWASRAQGAGIKGSKCIICHH